jgi:checkpoint serine/threonine-protein kinase
MPPSADELEAEREKLVEAVAVAKSGKPEDPIKAYHDYAEWLIAHRAEDKTSLFRLLKEATDAYKDSHDLYYDRRFLDIWCWYASRVNKPSAVYTFCLKRKIGTVFSKLYLEYGAYLIKTGE